MPARSARSSSSARSWAGRSSSSRSCGTGPTTAWSSARSRTSTRWACTPATRSPWRRRRRCPTSSTRPCGTRRSPACVGSGWRPAARTCSSPCNPRTGDQVIIEMNPRVSRSSALASKATGFPIAKIAARLAVGYTLDEITNDITRATPASFEPVIDYVVTKVPRWAFEKFPGTTAVLGTQMQSVGEVMAIGRTFPESLQKAMRSLEQGRFGLNADPGEQVWDRLDDDELLAAIAVPTPDRLFGVEAALRRIDVESVHGATTIDPWFLDQMAIIGEERVELAAAARSGGARPPAAGGGPSSSASATPSWPTCGRSTRPTVARGPRGARRAAHLQDRRHLRGGVRGGDAVLLLDLGGRGRGAAGRAGPGCIILGSGPNRIGQGIEFDYCCVHACFALGRGRLRHGDGQLQPRDRLHRLRHARAASTSSRSPPRTCATSSRRSGAAAPLVGVIVSLGGQTPLKLAGSAAARAGARHVAGGDRRRRGPRALDRPSAPASTSPSRPAAPPPPWTTRSPSPAASASRSWFGPPTCWAGGPCRSSTTTTSLRTAMEELTVSGSLGPGGRPVGRAAGADRPVPRGRHRGRRRRPARRRGRLHDRRDHGARRGGRRALRRLRLRAAAGDACRPRPSTCSSAYTRAIAEALDVPGPHQRPVRGEGRPGLRDRGEPAGLPDRAVRRQGRGVPLVKLAAWIMVGETLAELRADGLLRPPVHNGHIAVKEAVLPFSRFPESDAVLGPEMRSTGEVMGVDVTFGLAFAKSQLAAGTRLPAKGTVFMSLADRDKAHGRRRRPPLRRARPRDHRHLRDRRLARGRTASPCARSCPSSRRTGPNAVAADRLGPDRPRHQLAPGSRLPGRRRPHPPGRHPLPGAAADHRRRRAGGRSRHGRVGPPPSRRAHAAGAARRRHRPPTTTSSASRYEVGRARGRAGGPGTRSTCGPRSARWRCPTRS